MGAQRMIDAQERRIRVPASDSDTPSCLFVQGLVVAHISR